MPAGALRVAPAAHNMRLIVITPEALAPGEPAAARAMMRAGLQSLHLRKPAATRQQLRDYLTELGDPWTRRVMLHTHHNLADEFLLKVRHPWPRSPRGGRPGAPVNSEARARVAATWPLAR